MRKHCDGLLDNHILQSFATLDRAFWPFVIDPYKIIKPLGSADRLVARRAREIRPEFVKEARELRLCKPLKNAYGGKDGSARKAQTLVVVGRRLRRFSKIFLEEVICVPFQNATRFTFCAWFKLLDDAIMASGDFKPRSSTCLIEAPPSLRRVIVVAAGYLSGGVGIISLAVDYFSHA
ncbi:MAG: hypothetical protein WA231_21510 [Methylocella sp.]